MRPLTVHTITDPKLMLAELRNIRAAGISISNQENEAGITSVATGIRPNPSGPYVGFVSITAPLARAGADEFQRYRGLVLEAAQSLAERWPLPATTMVSDGVTVGEGMQVL